MLTAITLYEQQSGKILGHIESSKETIALNMEKAAHPYVMGKFLEAEHYIYGGIPRARPAMPTTLAGNTLVDVRSNSTIYINEAGYPCEEGGDVELEFDQPGRYTIRVVRWPYLDKEFTVEN